MGAHAEVVERPQPAAHTDVDHPEREETGAPPSRGPVRATTLSDGRTLELRSLGPEHLDGLVALYGGLTE